MAELADALVLGSSVHDVQVQVLLSALNNESPNLFPVGRGSDFFIFSKDKRSKEVPHPGFAPGMRRLLSRIGQWQEWEPQVCPASWS